MKKEEVESCTGSSFSLGLEPLAPVGALGRVLHSLRPDAPRNATGGGSPVAAAQLTHDLANVRPSALGASDVVHVRVPKSHAAVAWTPIKEEECPGLFRGSAGA